MDSEDVSKKILKHILSLLQDVGERNLAIPLIASVLLNFEDLSKALEQENRPTPFIQVAENLAKLFNAYLLSSIEPTQNGLNSIRETIGFLKKLNSDAGREKALLPAVLEINRKLELQLSAQEVTEGQVVQESTQ